jgi:hypothetical protein
MSLLLGVRAHAIETGLLLTWLDRLGCDNSVGTDEHLFARRAYLPKR